LIKIFKGIWVIHQIRTEPISLSYGPQIGIENRFDFDILLPISEIFLSSENAKNLINILNLVDDYAEQVDAEALKKIIDSQAVKTYWNFAYNNFFWTRIERKETTLDKRIKNAGPSKNLRKLYFSFQDCFDLEFG